MEYKEHFFMELREIYKQIDLSEFYTKSKDGYLFSEQGIKIIENGRLIFQMIYKCKFEGLLSLSDWDIKDPYILLFRDYIIDGFSPDYFSELGMFRYISNIAPTASLSDRLYYLFVYRAFIDISKNCNIASYMEYVKSILPAPLADMVLTDKEIEKKLAI